MRWPKITLTKHNIVTYDKKTQTFFLNVQLGDQQLIERAKQVCEAKIKDWINRKAAKDTTARVEASTRFRVLKAARGKCELCGISSKIAPIDIDHIIPQSRADKHGYVTRDGVKIDVNDERNLQALCFRCNRAKRDQDDTDFRLPVKKLVRDRIPDIMAASGRTPKVRHLRGKALETQLFEKLTEEHAELLSTTSEGRAEEIADMIEVLLALAKTSGYSEMQMMTLLHQKREERGDFSRGVFLEEQV
jgi:predicted house-cleaning noncanonical NTP pyrophosphatase (MazG superfamily)